MAHFSVYDTDVISSATGSSDQNNGAPPYPALKSEAELKLQPIQMDFAEYVSGSIESEKAGTLFIEQSFDYPKDHENEKIAIETAHWVPVESKRGGEELAAGIIVVGGKPVTFLVFAGAPYIRLRWKDTSKAENEKFRLFARAQEKGRI